MAVAGLDAALLGVAARVGGSSAAIAKPGRHVLHSGKLVLHDAGASAAAPTVEAYLCDDVLLLVQGEGRGTAVVATIDLSSGAVAVRDKLFLQVAALSSPSLAAPPFSFEVLAPGRIVTLAASSHDAKRAWLDAFTSALAA